MNEITSHNGGVGGGSGFRAAWSSRPWRGLVASFAVSGIGDWLYFTAFAVWLFERTGSPGWLGAAVFLRMLPYILFGALGGVIAERAPRRTLLIGLDLARAALMFALAALVAANGAPALAVAVAVSVSLLTVPYRPAIVAATPDVVPETALAAANSVEAIVGQLSVFIGPALASLLLAAGSAQSAIAIDALTFVASARIVASIPQRTALAGEVGDGGEASAAPRAESGLRVIRSTPGLGALLGLIVISVFTFGAEGVLHVVVAEERLGRGADFVGALTAAIGIGGLVASPLATRVARSALPGPWLVTCAVLSGSPLVALAALSSPALALAVLFVEGVGVILFEVLAITLVQRLAGPSLARVYGIQDSMSAGAQLAGAAIAPVIVGAVSLEAACVVSVAYCSPSHSWQDQPSCVAATAPRGLR